MSLCWTRTGWRHDLNTVYHQLVVSQLGCLCLCAVLRHLQVNTVSVLISSPLWLCFFWSFRILCYMEGSLWLLSTTKGTNCNKQMNKCYNEESENVKNLFICFFFFFFRLIWQDRCHCHVFFFVCFFKGQWEQSAWLFPLTNKTSYLFN